MTTRTAPMKHSYSAMLSAIGILLFGCATTAPVDPLVVPPSEAWRSAAPNPGQAPDVTAPTFASFSAPGGLVVIVHQRKDLPLVSIRYAIKGGSAHESPAQAGLANLTYQLLTEGAGGLDAVGLAEAFAELGSAVSAGSSTIGGSIGASALSKHADAVLGLLTKVVREPTLAADAFSRLQSRQLAELQRLESEPNHTASRALVEAVYGPDHPYGHLNVGSAASVTALTADDARAFWQRHFRPNQSALIFVGDISPREARELVARHTKGWEAATDELPVPPGLQASKRAEVLMVPMPGLEQTIIAMGRPGIDQGHPDEWALRVAVGAWGGTFGSRLNMNLREDKGYTYGARAYVRPQQGAGSLVLSTSVRRDVTGPALSEILKELEQVRTRPLTEEELGAARDSLLLSIPGSFETIQSLAGTAADLFTSALPLDHYATMIDGYEKLDPRAARAAGERWLLADHFQIVLVGDPETIHKACQDLGLGPVRDVSAK